ncbi:hypothetical protein HYU23_03455 [Candidatus Woesearchaeota archaeon]|nr:hypothetical protein [Candidatus Woesearchaeota archaeon]
MFIRVKKVKKRSGKIYEYAHLVNGIWKRRKIVNVEGIRRFKQFNNSVHKYNKFLGRVYRFRDKKEGVGSEEFFRDFEDFVNKNNIDSIYRGFVGYELFCRGFRKIGDVYKKENIFVDLNRLIIHDGKNDVVIKLNDVGGYLCSLNLEELFRIKKIENKYEGVYLMKRLKAVGINLNSNQFYFIADKLLRECPTNKNT